MGEKETSRFLTSAAQFRQFAAPGWRQAHQPKQLLNC
jgi:hypothetical protein